MERTEGCGMIRRTFATLSGLLILWIVFITILSSLDIIDVRHQVIRWDLVVSFSFAVSSFFGGIASGTFTGRGDFLTWWSPSIIIVMIIFPLLLETPSLPWLLVSLCVLEGIITATLGGRLANRFINMELEKNYTI